MKELVTRKWSHIMISVICVYNDRDILNRFLLRNLRESSDEYELILLDNTGGRFRSAAEALNHGAVMASGDVFIFTHQDVEVSPEELLQMESYSESNEELGVAGAAGVSAPFRVFSNMKHGDPPVNVGRRINGPVKVQTVDECLFMVPADVFRRYRFDEETCTGWHLCAVDYCLTVLAKGYDVCAILVSAYHGSPGYSISEDYYSTMELIIRKHRAPIICTSLGFYTPYIPMAIQRGFREFLIRRSIKR
jgi:glycosyltransferase involved in cell wall biosynthesis